MSSPYKFHTAKKDGFYSFESKNGINYKCFFTQKSDDINDFLGLRLKSPVFYFSFNRSEKDTPVVYDRRIGLTIAEILTQFFNKNPHAIIAYICDDSDYKAIKRQNHFEKWFTAHNNSPRKTLMKAEIRDVIYAGAIMLMEHPEKNKVKKFFSKEIKNLNESDKSGELNVIE